MSNETTNAGAITDAATSPDSTANHRARFTWDPSSCVRYFQARRVLRQLAYANALTADEITQTHIAVTTRISWCLTDSEIALDPPPQAITTRDQTTNQSSSLCKLRA